MSQQLEDNDAGFVANLAGISLIKSNSIENFVSPRNLKKLQYNNDNRNVAKPSELNSPITTKFTKPEDFDSLSSTQDFTNPSSPTIDFPSILLNLTGTFLYMTNYYVIGPTSSRYMTVLGGDEALSGMLIG